jgi:hypothetical protein
MPDQLTKDQPGSINIHRSGGMVLDPLAEIGVGMLMAVVICCGQFVMDILRHGKRRQPKEDDDHPQREHRTEENQHSRQ